MRIIKKEIVEYIDDISFCHLYNGFIIKFILQYISHRSYELHHNLVFSTKKYVGILNLGSLRRYYLCG